MKKLCCAVLLIALALCLCACGSPAVPAEPAAAKPLPAPSVNAESQFGVDTNINISNIDEWLGRDDAVYRDVRMLFDPADYAAIGGEADLTHTIEGFKVVPFPYVATLQALPVDGAYEGDCLFTVEWNADGSVKSAEANYSESMMILEELFPKDKAVFLMCGGGGYAGMMKQLLLFLDWDENLLYNIGANWEYTGSRGIELVVYPEEAGGHNIYATWRADYAYIDFTRLEKLQ